MNAYTELVYSSRRVPLTRHRIVPSDYPTRPGRDLIGTFLNGVLIAQNDFLPGDPMADAPPMATQLALAGEEVGPGQGIRATLFAMMPLAAEQDEESTDPEARWRDSVPAFETSAGEIVPRGFGLIVLGQLARLAETRRHPDDLAAELAHMLQNILARQVTTLGHQAVEALTRPSSPDPR